MSYRNDLDALAARHDALEAEVAETTRERDRVADLLADAKARAKLPVLPNIRVATRPMPLAAPVTRTTWSVRSGTMVPSVDRTPCIQPPRPRRRCPGMSRSRR